MKFLFALLMAAVVALAADAPSFEAASIRPAAPSPLPIPVAAWFQGGPGTNDPLRIRYTNVTLQDLLARAYGLEPLQVSGPGWISGERYEITATLPGGTNKEQLLVMLQGLLNERFKVQMRRESKAIPVYELTANSGGPKLKSAETVPEIIDNAEKSKSDALAGLQEDLDRARSGRPPRPARGFHIARGTLPDLIKGLSPNVDRPIVDQTHVTGLFSFDVQWTPASMNSSDGNPDIFAAIKEQLGLKLSPRNDVLETIVVESAERAPAN